LVYIVIKLAKKKKDKRQTKAVKAPPSDDAPQGAVGLGGGKAQAFGHEKGA